MFAIPPIPKKYVVIGSFKSRDWYLADANRQPNTDTTIRTWTAVPGEALTFDNRADAEQIAEIICPDDVKYKIGGISKNTQ